MVGVRGFGVNSIRASLDNWNVYYPVKARVFWICYPAPGSGVPAVKADGARADSPLPPSTLGQVRGGDEGDDRLRGDELDNAVVGQGGDDRLWGGDGEDHLHAGAGDDSLSGGDHADLLHAPSGDDVASGGGGVDDILTGKGDDVSKGGVGGDQLFDDQGHDILRGGPGNDRFSAHDGDRDRIDCGPGEDIALIDGKDVTKHCEHTYRNKREAPRKLPRI